MVREVIMPQYSVTMEEGTISEWKIKEGDYVKKGQVILEIETDKIAMDIEAEYDGHIRKILYEDGDVVKVTKTIAYLSDSMDEEIDITDKKREVENVVEIKESR